MKKLVCFVLAASLIMAMLFGCAPQAAEEKTKLEQIREAGELVVGTSPDYPPYEFIIPAEDGSESYVGIDIDIAKRIAADIGVELKIEAMDFDGLDSALQMGVIDMIMAAYNATEERAEVMDFSDVYYIDEVCAFTLADNAASYTDLNSFAGKKVGVQLGSTLETDYFPMMEGAEKVALKKIPQLITELKAGSLDAIIVEKPIAESYIQNNPDLAITSVVFNDGASGYVVGLPKGAEDLQASINETIKKLIDADEISGFAETAQEIQDQAILPE